MSYVVFGPDGQTDRAFVLHSIINYVCVKSHE